MSRVMIVDKIWGDQEHNEQILQIRCRSETFLFLCVRENQSTQLQLNSTVSKKVRKNG